MSRRAGACAAAAALLAAAPAAAAPRVANVGLAAADRAAWRAALGWSDACERPYRSAFPDGAVNAGLRFWGLDGSRLLVRVSCGAGAYQPVSTLYLVDGGRGTPSTRGIALTVYEAPGTRLVRRRARIVAGLLDWRPRTRRLVLHTRFRGLGDCGALVAYAPRDGRFVPVEVRAKLACDGRPPFDPARWPRRRL
jgi:hypothetical protein